MMKVICDCGCGQQITEYDAGALPVIVRKGDLVMELRVIPGPGPRPNVRPFCMRSAVAEGDVIFPAPSASHEDAGVSYLGDRVRSITPKLGSAAESEDAVSADRSGKNAPVAKAH